ncbi:MAG: tyrosine-protein phosphatase [Planctomycetes bacterium]|nr:tyrosine-protein phosphatase [Planctomycetota bacterium]
MNCRLLLLAVAAATGACANLRDVGTNGAYRCSQPDEDLLQRWIDRHDIRTVVCLRGVGDQSKVTERAALSADIEFVQVPMSATRLPAPETLLSLWDVCAHASRPLVFHCRAGVDRTGLASALCVLHDTGDLERARGELALIPNGHTGLLGTAAMDEVLEQYEPHHGVMAFPDWVRDVYAPTMLGK